MSDVEHDRFWRFVDKSIGCGPKGDCWQWKGATAKGYGQVQYKPGHSPRTGAHRYSYRLRFGEITGGRLVCHRCDNPLCVNPDHLFLGSHADNSADCVAKARTCAGEMRSKLTRGSRNGRARISEADAMIIRASKLPQKQIAAKYAISESAVGHIQRGRTWKHLTEDKA